VLLKIKLKPAKHRLLLLFHRLIRSKRLQIYSKKEYAFLTAQQADLEQRLTAFDSRARQEVSQAETRIDALQGTIIALQSRGDRINDLLLESERNIESIEDNRGTLESTFQQATATMEQQGFQQFQDEAFEQLDDLSKIDQLFAITEIFTSHEINLFTSSKTNSLLGLPPK